MAKKYHSWTVAEIKELEGLVENNGAVGAARLFHSRHPETSYYTAEQYARVLRRQLKKKREAEIPVVKVGTFHWDDLYIGTGAGR